MESKGPQVCFMAHLMFPEYLYTKLILKNLGWFLPDFLTKWEGFLLNSFPQQITEAAIVRKLIFDSPLNVGGLEGDQWNDALPMEMYGMVFL